MLRLTIAAVAACRIEVSQRGGPLQWHVVLKWFHMKKITMRVDHMSEIFCALLFILAIIFNAN